MMQDVLTTESIGADELVTKGRQPHPECGGLCTFEGIVRNHHGGRGVKYLEYEAYTSMAVKELQTLKSEIMQEWPMIHVEVRHRIGRLKIGDVAVAIAVWAPHRREAFAACEAMIDRIKNRVPIWKHEFYEDGTDQWVMCTHD